MITKVKNTWERLVSSYSGPAVLFVTFCALIYSIAIASLLAFIVVLPIPFLFELFYPLTK